jgi:cytochrome oxidase Cu insertion factor (SCO1/SenC/PrrC family)
MSSRVTRERPPSARVRRAVAKQEAARRRRVGVVVAGGVVVALVAAVVGLRFAGGSGPATGGAARSGGAPAPGDVAPNATFTTLSGRTETVASLRGHPTLLWLMTTWCSSCQASTETLAKNLPALEADGVRVVEVENYEDLGESGPSVAEFAKVLAGSEYTSPEWTFGEASLGLTQTYNPASDLDVYYLLNAAGRVVYVNSTPAATMSEILAHAAKLS